VFHDIQQNTDEWLALRLGKITGSAVSKAMAHFGKAFGEPAKQYAVNIAIEQITGKSASSGGYSNAHMERGHEEEPLARAAYEDLFFYDVDNGGFFEVDDQGCSPDGLVGLDGLVEIKSAISSVHYKRISSGKFDPQYRWQYAYNLLMTGRDWIDFVSYCSTYPEHSQLYVVRTTKEEFSKEFDMLNERIPEFKALIAEAKENILNSKTIYV